MVVKSLSVEPVAGNPAPRVHEVGGRHAQQRRAPGPRAGGLGGRRPPGAARPPGRGSWSASGASTVDDYARAAEPCWPAVAPGVHRGPRGQRELPQRRGPLADVRPLGRRPRPRVVAATACGLPRWAKLSPNVPDLVEIAGGRPRGGGRGADAGQHAARPGHRHRDGPARARAPAGAGSRGRRPPGGGARRVGVPRRLPRRCPSSAWAACARGATPSSCCMAGADAVQVGTATFRDPRAPWKVLRQLTRWCATAHATSAPWRAAARRQARRRGRRRRDARSEEDVMADSFGDRVAAAVGAHGPLCAGIDPSGALLGAWGLRRRRRGSARASAGACVEAFAGVVPVIKPQVAFFERHGSAGMAALERAASPRPRAAGLLVIADAKRGDIDSTAAAYADAWLGDGSPLAADAVTAHPYLGLGALAPTGPPGRRHRPGRPRGGPQLEPRGRELQEAVTAGGCSGRGHAAGRDRRAQRLARRARRDGRGRGRAPPWSRRRSRCPSSEG